MLSGIESESESPSILKAPSLQYEEGDSKELQAGEQRLAPLACCSASEHRRTSVRANAVSIKLWSSLIESS